MKDNGYKLSSTDIPELYKIKSNHRELMRAYAESLAVVSRLSFFVGMNEIRPPKDGAIKRIIFKIVWGTYSPLRLLAWRPVVGLFVEAHLHRKMRELVIGYNQFKFLVSTLYPRQEEYLIWLDRAKDECRQLLETIASGKIFFDVIKFFFSLLINILITAWGVNSLFELTIKLASLKPPAQGLEFIAKIIIFILSAIPVLLMFVDATFAAKRAIFLNINLGKEETSTVYKIENELFANLNRGKAKETPIDFFVGTFYYLIFILSIWLLGFVLPLTIQAQGSSKITHIYYLWCLIVPVIISYVTDVISPWLKRKREGEL